MGTTWYLQLCVAHLIAGEQNPEGQQSLEEQNFKRRAKVNWARVRARARAKVN